MRPSAIVVVSVTPELCPDLPARAEAMLAAGTDRVVLDLAQVLFLNSLQIAGIISFRQVIHASGGRVAVANLDPAMRKVFETLRIDRIFALHLDLAAAKAAVG